MSDNSAYTPLCTGLTSGGPDGLQLKRPLDGVVDRVHTAAGFPPSPPPPPPGNDVLNYAAAKAAVLTRHPVQGRPIHAGTHVKLIRRRSSVRFPFSDRILKKNFFANEIINFMFYRIDNKSHRHGEGEGRFAEVPRR